MLSWFVVPDAHGRDDLVKGLLRKAGALAPRAERTRGWKTVQLGDLGNCVAATRDGDLSCFTEAAEWFDVVLVGNHEHPYFHGPAFSGFAWFAEVEEKLRVLDRAGILQPSLLLGNTLLTHAGVAATPQWKFLDAPDAHEQIQKRWRLDRARDPLFSQIGEVRGGWTPFGGILWSDWSELKNNAFAQVFGHTPMRDGEPVFQLNDGFALNLDCSTETSLAGIWLSDEGLVGDQLSLVRFDLEEARADA